MKFNRYMGFPPVVSHMWLILIGLSVFTSMGSLSVTLTLLAMAAGIFILLSL